MKPGQVPLERAISKLGIASRSRARQLVLNGQVRVNGVLRADPQFPVVPEKAKILINDREVSKAPPRTLMLHKPRGVVTTSSDEKNRPTVFSLIKDGGLHLSAVGRLDWATSGLLLLTNDTRLADWLTDPRNGIQRVYLATVRERVTDDELDRLRAGINDAGQELLAREIVLRKSSERESHLTITLGEGKNREIRRMFAAVNHEVTRLKRVGYGGLELGGLQPGEYRELTGLDLSLLAANG
jgi:23S rRNA pseudouridine2605 synthase